MRWTRAQDYFNVSVACRLTSRHRLPGASPPKYVSSHHVRRVPKVDPRHERSRYSGRSLFYRMLHPTARPTSIIHKVRVILSQTLGSQSWRLTRSFHICRVPQLKDLLIPESQLGSQSSR